MSCRKIENRGQYIIDIGTLISFSSRVHEVNITNFFQFFSMYGICVINAIMVCNFPKKNDVVFKSIDWVFFCEQFQLWYENIMCF